MTVVDYSLDTILPPEEIQTAFIMVDKSPLKPKRQISGLDIANAKPISLKSLDTSKSSAGSKKKKKKKKSLDPLAISNHSTNSSRKSKKSKKSKNKRKKDALSQSAHTISKSTKDDSLIGSDILLGVDSNNSSSHQLQVTTTTNRRPMPSRRNLLKRNHSVPTMASDDDDFDSDGDSTMEGSWKGQQQEPRGRSRSAKSKGASEIEAFLDQIINDSRVPKGPIESIRSRARGRSRNATRVKNDDDNDNDEDEYILLNDEPTSENKDGTTPGGQRRDSSGEKIRPKSLMALLDESSRSSMTAGQRRSSTSSGRFSASSGRAKSFASESTSSSAQSLSDGHVVSLSIQGEEKIFTLSESDIDVIEAFLETKSKEAAAAAAKTALSSLPQTRTPKRRSTSASRAAKRAELFDDLLLTSGRSGVLADMSSAGGKGSNNKDDLMQSMRDELLFSERMQRSHSDASKLPEAKQSKTLSNLQRFNQIQRIPGGGQRMSVPTTVTPSQKPRSVSLERKSKHWQDFPDSRLADLELDTIEDEGSYCLSKSTTRRWSLSDSMSVSLRLSLDGSHRFQQLQQLPVEKRSGSKDWGEKRPLHAVKSPRKGRKPAAAAPKECDVTKIGGPDVVEVPDGEKRRSRSGGRRPRRSRKDTSKSDDEGHDDIENSPGDVPRSVERLPFFMREKLQSDDEASQLEVSCKGQTLEQLVAMSPQRYKNDVHEPFDGDNGVTTPRKKRHSKKSPLRNSTPNGAQIYKLDLGEARWTTTPTSHLKGKRSTVDPLDLQLPFGSPSGILKTNKLGLVEPSTLPSSFRKRNIPKKKKRIDEGDILEFDEDNATVVSDITEAVLDSSLRSTLSASVRSNPGSPDDPEEPLRGKWEPKIEKIKETSGSQSDLFSSKGDLGAVSPPSPCKDLGPGLSPQSPATPGGTARFSWMKKLPFSKKK
ncbi:unnamed protein product [Cylindrotheca closterium]|uniref:Uncharacterized protein n=1 Tax=Cylindrotheca closterium TaxID=2856 RepID=A0AAD2FWA7_9STRA|nr:unnamed protein product [Cylindrotheca closterium]